MNTPITQFGAAAPRDVDDNYTHLDKLVMPAEMLSLPDSTLKWYNLAAEGKTVPAEIERAARNRLLAEADGGTVREFGELGFVILHRCGKDFYFLLASTWRNNNELWETVYAKDSDKQAEFSRFQTGVDHRPTFCVWELAAVSHEKDAWGRFLLSERRPSNRLEYLDDTYKGAA